MMDIQSSNKDLATPLSYKSLSFCKAEDSGYHTSLASPTLECSSTSENLDPPFGLPNYCKIQVDCYPFTSSTDVRPTLSVCYNNRTGASFGNSEISPFTKKGVKRPYDDEIEPVSSEISYCITTPTSIIANEVQKLKVHDAKFNSTTISHDSGHFDIYYKDYHGAESHPTTPIKKICRSSCNLSPFNHRKTARKVDFAIHSLSCEGQVLKLQTKTQSKIAKPITFSYKPNQKIDIVKLLYSHEDYCSTSIRKILSFLSQEDVYNFTLVSPTWCKIFKSTNTKQNCNHFFNTVKSNLENWEQIETLRSSDNCQIKPLKEIQNVRLAVSTPRSPILRTSPRTNRFNKFTKAASLDGRSQLACINCQHPAKVTIEATGEQWVECTSSSCAHQFCKLCMCHRHPGKSCVQYDLVDGPSPSKRQKRECTVSSNKSKKKLKRLLF